MFIPIEATSGYFQPTPYQSAVALDEYGNSVQLRNARECSLRYGLPIIAAVSTVDQSIVVCSLHPQSTAAGGNMIPSRSDIPRVVHVIASEDVEEEDNNSSDSIRREACQTIFCPTITALVCSGLKADAALLRTILRERSRRLWERYDILPSPPHIADASTQIFLSFFQYNRNREVNDEAGPIDSTNPDDNSSPRNFEMSRPFGLHILVLGIRQHQHPPIIISVDSSGIQRYHPNFIAIGKRSREANEKLKKLWKKDLNIQQIREICCSVLTEFKQDEKDAVHTEILSPLLQKAVNPDI
jgi:20S proteasome alpha/beta subunit